jgi:hypothetical protein
MFKFVREASEKTWSGQLIVAALRVSPVRMEGRLPAVMEASRASFTPERVPVPPSTVVNPRTVELTALADPVTDDVVVVGLGIGSGFGIGTGV